MHNFIPSLLLLLHHPIFLFLFACNDALSFSFSLYCLPVFWKWFVCLQEAGRMVGRGPIILTLNIINKSSPFQFKRLINSTDTSQQGVDHPSLFLYCSVHERIETERGIIRLWQKVLIMSLLDFYLCIYFSQGLSLTVAITKMKLVHLFSLCWWYTNLLL